MLEYELNSSDCEQGRLIVAGFCEYGNKPSDSVKHREFVCQESDQKLLKDLAPWN
jgi:hypothetical protein